MFVSILPTKDHITFHNVSEHNRRIITIEKSQWVMGGSRALLKKKYKKKTKAFHWAFYFMMMADTFHQTKIKKKQNKCLLVNFHET